MDESWKVRRGTEKFPVRDETMLREWANTDRIRADDHVFNPVLEKWMYAPDVAQIAGAFEQQKEKSENETLTKMSWGLGCLGFQALFLFWPAGVALLIIAVVMSARVSRDAVGGYQ
jgi:hypothetical protein